MEYFKDKANVVCSDKEVVGCAYQYGHCCFFAGVVSKTISEKRKPANN
jgi:hypothetical protein